jgi:hypothetical protein
MSQVHKSIELHSALSTYQQEQYLLIMHRLLSAQEIMDDIDKQCVVYHLLTQILISC